MTATASGSSSVVAVLNPVNPSIATTSTASRQDCGRSLSQALNACLERPSTMSRSRAGADAVADPGQVDDHGDVLLTGYGRAGVSPVGSARGAVPGLLRV